MTHFQRGEALLENLRTTEAVEELNQALKLDPGFAAAQSFRGFATPGPDGLKEMEAATLAAGSLPEAERALIEGNTANRRGDLEKAAARIAASSSWRRPTFSAITCSASSCLAIRNMPTRPRR